jgi:hypothetical protein
MAVSRALKRKIPPGDGVVRVVCEPIGYALGALLDRRALHLTELASYIGAERALAELEAEHPVVRLVVLAGVEWTLRLRSAAGARMWPRMFEPLTGLTTAERQAFVRRAFNHAVVAKPVCGITPVV